MKNISELPNNLISSSLLDHKKLGHVELKIFNEIQNISYYNNLVGKDKTNSVSSLCITVALKR